MPRFAVLRFRSGDADRLMLEPLRDRMAPPPGVSVAGVLQLPMSTRFVSLAPPVLDIPNQGRHALEDIVHGRVALDGVVWQPAPDPAADLPPDPALRR